MRDKFFPIFPKNFADIGMYDDMFFFILFLHSFDSLQFNMVSSRVVILPTALKMQHTKHWKLRSPDYENVRKSNYFFSNLSPFHLVTVPHYTDFLNNWNICLIHISHSQFTIYIVCAFMLRFYRLYMVMMTMIILYNVQWTIYSELYPNSVVRHGAERKRTREKVCVCVCVTLSVRINGVYNIQDSFINIVSEIMIQLLSYCCCLLLAASDSLPCTQFKSVVDFIENIKLEFIAMVYFVSYNWNHLF